VESVQWERAPCATAGPEPADFAGWIRPHWVDLHRLASRMCGPSDADDVVQDSVSAAWLKRAQFDPARGRPRSWLLAIVADQARKHRKRVAARAWEELTDEIGGSGADSGTDAVDIGAAIDRLTERQRLTVSLFYYLDLPVVEVAEVLACSVGTVKSTLSDARALSRDCRWRAWSSDSSVRSGSGDSPTPRRGSHIVFWMLRASQSSTTSRRGARCP
jgi:RNA polymerase sigma factor (sigma-70 family)